MKKSFLNKLTSVLPSLSLFINESENCLFLSSTKLVFSLSCLKSHINYRYTLLSCVSGVDFIHSQYRFGVVYDLLSITHNSRLRIKIFVNEMTSVDSIVRIYKNSNWWEREIWDLYGVYFNDHPDLRRILTDYGFEGYPMRKDFPLSGYVELRYDEGKKRIVLESLELMQEFRSFSYDLPW